ncbi:OsmC family protein [Microbacterium sp.]|uniref:OsmC family protein n=1 Tax=Microbacterium sp. TaxID=51671 RepID=UPI002D77E8DD|nr:OsmC family protein [Microbacterium sp.]HET6300745.1 OsmC family protein [Microbacterium sp.]
MTMIEERARMNGVDVATLFATLDAVKETPEIAKFQFRASNTWVAGTHSRSMFQGFHGAMQEMEHKAVTTVDSDHPAVLVGEDNGPTPVEYLLHGIAACLTAGLANIAAARKVRLNSVTSTVEGDIDLLGILGMGGGEVRNGYQAIRVKFEIDADADEETVRELVAQSQRRSAVYDVLVNGTSVDVAVSVF